MWKIKKNELSAFEIYKRILGERYSMNGLPEEDYQTQCLKILVRVYRELGMVATKGEGLMSKHYGEELLLGNINLYCALTEKNYGKACGVLEDLIHLFENHKNIKDIMVYLQYTIKKGLEQSGIFMVEKGNEKREQTNRKISWW